MFFHKDSLLSKNNIIIAEKNSQLIICDLEKTINALISEDLLVGKKVFGM